MMICLCVCVSVCGGVCVCVCVYLRKKMMRIEERIQFVLHKEERERKKAQNMKLIKYGIHKLQWSCIYIFDGVAMHICTVTIARCSKYAQF